MPDRYAVGTGAWRPRPFMVNMLTYSDRRYRRNLRYYADYPELQLGGQQVMAPAEAITTPVLLQQGGEEKIVDNLSHWAFCPAMAWAGHPCENNGPITMKGARHEILFETDPLRAQALTLIANFFMRHH